MIKFEHLEVFNFDGALRGMRHPLNSHHLSDSRMSHIEGNKYEYVVGEKDFNLALRLAKAGSDHGKFLRQISVCVDIIAPDYWFKEYDTYKVGTVANSSSTMHTLCKQPLTLENFSIDNPDGHDKDTIKTLNKLIEEFKLTDDKDIWRKLIQKLPMSFNYTRTCTLNYAVLRNMYHSRKNHKLAEWRSFCVWVESLPYSELITCKKGD